MIYTVYCMPTDLTGFLENPLRSQTLEDARPQVARVIDIVAERFFNSLLIDPIIY